jgi:hypothetical protein
MELERISERFFSNLWKCEEICAEMMTSCEPERQVPSVEINSKNV